MAYPITVTTPPVNGFGTLSITTNSVAISTVTVGPNSPAYPTTLPNEAVSITNAGTAVAYVCPLGGTCKTSNGVPLAVNETRTFNIGGNTTAPTVISGSAATLIITW